MAGVLNGVPGELAKAGVRCHAPVAEAQDIILLVLVLDFIVFDCEDDWDSVRWLEIHLAAGR